MLNLQFYQLFVMQNSLPMLVMLDVKACIAIDVLMRARCCANLIEKVLHVRASASDAQTLHSVLCFFFPSMTLFLVCLNGRFYPCVRRTRPLPRRTLIMLMMMMMLMSAENIVSPSGSTMIWLRIVPAW